MKICRDERNILAVVVANFSEWKIKNIYKFRCHSRNFEFIKLKLVKITLKSSLYYV